MAITGRTSSRRTPAALAAAFRHGEGGANSCSNGSHRLPPGMLAKLRSPHSWPAEGQASSSAPTRIHRAGDGERSQLPSRNRSSFHRDRRENVGRLRWPIPCIVHSSTVRSGIVRSGIARSGTAGYSIIALRPMSACSARSSRFRILPLGFLGRWSAMTTYFGAL